MAQPGPEHDKKKNVLKMLDCVSAQLGNTRTVCKKYYVHPVIIALYENDELDKYIRQSVKINGNNSQIGLTTDEQIIMKILESG